MLGNFDLKSQLFKLMMKVVRQGLAQADILQFLRCTWNKKLIKPVPVLYSTPGTLGTLTLKVVNNLTDPQSTTSPNFIRRILRGSELCGVVINYRY